MSRAHSLVLALVCSLGCGQATRRADPTATAEPPLKTPELRITTAAVLLGEESVVLLSGDRTRGVPAEHKRSGANDLYVTPLADALRRAQDQGRLSRMTATSKAELVVIVDPSTTYRVLFEVMFTAGQTELDRYQLVEGERGGRVVEAEPPSVYKPPPLDSLGMPVAPPGLNLAMILLPDGMALKVSSGNVAPGCDNIGKGIALPKLTTGHDLAGLTQCAKKLKASNPSLAGEKAMTLTASPGTPFREVVDAVLALRGSDAEPLFPKVIFAVAR